MVGGGRYFYASRRMVHKGEDISALITGEVWCDDP